MATTNETRKEVMKAAHALAHLRGYGQFGECLRQAWADVKAKQQAETEPAAEMEKHYDELFNEGGEGYNPHRNGASFTSKTAYYEARDEMLARAKASAERAQAAKAAAERRKEEGKEYTIPEHTPDYPLCYSASKFNN